MKNHDEDPQFRELEIVCEALGDRVQEVWREHFLYYGELNTSVGEVTLLFSSGRRFQFAGRHDGFGLVVTVPASLPTTADPSGERDASIPEDWGEFLWICVTHDAAWRPIVGQQLVSVAAVIHWQFDSVAGLCLRFGSGASVYVLNLADDVTVETQVDPAELREQALCSTRNVASDDDRSLPP